MGSHVENECKPFPPLKSMSLIVVKLSAFIATNNINNGGYNHHQIMTRLQYILSKIDVIQDEML